ncbi:ABC transporter substrate-binding protein, partial [Streptomyces sp. NPDC006356]
MRIASPRGPRRWALPVTVAATVLATTSCGGGSSAASSQHETLALAILGTPNSFAPTQVVDGQQTYVWLSIYDTLLVQDNKGELKPGAAQSWTYSDDARTLTLKLRPGMKFSSGSPVTSAAVKATLDAIRAKPGPNQAALAAVSAVETQGDLGVVLKLRTPDGALLSALAAACGIIADPKTMNAKSAALDPVGSGPYVLDTSKTVNGSVYVLKRRDDYWNKKAYPFPTVKVRVIPDSTAAVNALKAGEINATSVEAAKVSSFSSGDFKISKVAATAVGNLVLADRSGSLLKPLADVRVRKAINMAFDREKIVQRVL